MHISIHYCYEHVKIKLPCAQQGRRHSAAVDVHSDYDLKTNTVSQYVLKLYSMHVLARVQSSQRFGATTNDNIV